MREPATVAMGLRRQHIWRQASGSRVAWSLAISRGCVSACDTYYQSEQSLCPATETQRIMTGEMLCLLKWVLC